MRSSLFATLPKAPNIIGPRFVTGADGRFVFSVVDGGKYDVHATRYMGADVGHE